MTSEEVDLRARHAAMLLHSGRVSAVSEAIRIAGRGLPIPRTLLRRHMAAMEKQEIGEAAVKKRHAGILEVAIEFMDAIEMHFERFPERYPEAMGTRLAGRAAGGLLDGDPVVHIRVLAEMPPAEVVHLIMETGCEEPRIELLKSRVGKLDRIRTQLDGVEVVLTLCPPQRGGTTESLDLVLATPIRMADRDAVMELLEAFRGEN